MDLSCRVADFIVYAEKLYELPVPGFVAERRSSRLSRRELLDEIERLRAEMAGLTAAGADYDKLLELSRQLDKLIVLFYKFDENDSRNGYS
jgi:hypothetical protein